MEYIKSIEARDIADLVARRQQICNQLSETYEQEINIRKQLELKRETLRHELMATENALRDQCNHNWTICNKSDLYRNYCDKCGISK